MKFQNLFRVAKQGGKCNAGTNTGKNSMSPKYINDHLMAYFQKSLSCWFCFKVSGLKTPCPSINLLVNVDRNY